MYIYYFRNYGIRNPAVEEALRLLEQEPVKIHSEPEAPVRHRRAPAK